MDKASQERAPLWMAGLILSPAVLVNLWKVLGRGYALYEIWGHLILDVAVVALLITVILTNPVENPVVYGVLYTLFTAAYLGNYWPTSILEWLGAAVVLSLLGVFVFPRLAVITPWVSLGLLIAYTVILRAYLPELNRGEALAVLASKNASKTSAGFLHDVFNYQRNFLGREKYRYYVEPNPGYVGRLKAVGHLHAQVYLSLKKQGISFLYWNDMRFQITESQDLVVARYAGGTLEGVMLEEDKAGYHLACTAAVLPFELAMKKEADGTFRITQVPENITVTLKETLPARPIR